MNQTEYQKTGSGDSQNDRIAARLLESKGEWVPMPELERVSGSRRLNSRAADLRKRGLTVECRTEHKGGKVHSFYRIP